MFNLFFHLKMLFYLDMIFDSNNLKPVILSMNIQMAAATILGGNTNLLATSHPSFLIWDKRDKHTATLTLHSLKTRYHHHSRQDIIAITARPRDPRKFHVPGFKFLGVLGLDIEHLSSAVISIMGAAIHRASV